MHSQFNNLLASLLFLILSSCGSSDSPNPTHQVSELIGCNDDLATNAADFSLSDASCSYAPISCESCDYVLEPNDVILDNDELKLPIGSRVCLRGGTDRRSVIIRNFHGTEENPFIFTNCDGLVTVKEDLPGIKLHESSFIRLTGTGSDDQYGIKVAQSRVFGIVAELRTTNFEIDHVEVTGSDVVAISARTRPVCDGSSNRGTFTQLNTKIHHNYLHDIGGEGTYIGGSHWHSFFTSNECSGLELLEPELKGVEVHNNIVENTGQDGIQVGGAVEGCKIYNNRITNYGLKEIGVHQAGIMVNPGTTGDVFSNTIIGGTGNAIFLNGFNNLVYSNLIVDCAKNAFHIGDRNPPANMSYKILNNTVVGTSMALYMNSKLSVNNLFQNNLLVEITGEVMNKLTNEFDLDTTNNVITSSVANLQLVDPANYDFSPTATSPLYNAGLAHADIELLLDLMLRDRHVGGSIDIGAFEGQ